MSDIIWIQEEFGVSILPGIGFLGDPSPEFEIGSVEVLQSTRDRFGHVQYQLMFEPALFSDVAIRLDRFV